MSKEQQNGQQNPNDQANQPGGDQPNPGDNANANASGGPGPSTSGSAGTNAGKDAGKDAKDPKKKQRLAILEGKTRGRFHATTLRQYDPFTQTYFEPSGDGVDSRKVTPAKEGSWLDCALEAGTIVFKAD